MNRRSFIGLLGLLGCKDELENMNKAKLNWWTQNSAEVIPGVSMSGITTVYALGDSITAGQNASPSSNYYIERFKSANSLSSLTNLATSGRGAWNQIQAFKNQTYTRSSTCVVAMVGLNDIRRNGNNSKTLKKIETGFRYFIDKHIGATNTSSGAASVTRSGTFSPGNFSTLGSVYSSITALPNAAATTLSSVVNSYWEFTFTGTGIGICFFANDGVTNSEDYGNATVTIDGNTVDSIVSKGVYYDGVSDGAYDNARGPVTKLYTGLTNASHTIRVTHTSGTYFVLERFFTLTATSGVGPLFFCEIPYLNSTGYAVSPSSATAAISDEASALINSVVTEYYNLGYPVRYVRTNSYYNLSTGLDTDNIHPNNTGHEQIANALQAVII